MAASDNGDSARAGILGRIRNGLGRDAGRSKAVAEARLAAPPASTVPAMAQTSGAERRDAFARRVEASAASFQTLPDLAELPAAVAAFQHAHGLPASVRVSTDERLTGLAWAEAGVTAENGPGAGGDRCGLAVAAAGIAETGQLVLASGPRQPASLAFLPESFLGVVFEPDLVGGLDDAWALLSARGLAGPHGARAIHFVAGPSRSADIEQTLQLGAHGPKRVHVLLVGAGGAGG